MKGRGGRVLENQAEQVWTSEVHRGMDFSCVCVCAQLCPTLCDPRGQTATHQPPLSMGFSRQEYWSGCIYSSRGSSRPRDWICISCVSCIAGIFFATRKAPSQTDIHSKVGKKKKKNNLESPVISIASFPLAFFIQWNLKEKIEWILIIKLLTSSQEI